MNFRLNFPSGYNSTDLFNDNIDLNVILDTHEVYFITAFTVKNIQHLVDTEDKLYFMASDMLILNDLRIQTIKDSVNDILEKGLITHFTFIGDVNSVFGEPPEFGELH